MRPDAPGAPERWRVPNQTNVVSCRDPSGEGTRSQPGLRSDRHRLATPCSRSLAERRRFSKPHHAGSIPAESAKVGVAFEKRWVIGLQSAAEHERFATEPGARERLKPEFFQVRFLIYLDWSRGPKDGREPPKLVGAGSIPAVTAMHPWSNWMGTGLRSRARKRNAGSSPVGCAEHVTLAVDEAVGDAGGGEADRAR